MSDFDSHMPSLRTLLDSAGKDRPSAAEEQALRNAYASGMTVFELLDLLWSNRFYAYLQILHGYLPEISLKEVKALARTCFRIGLTPKDAADAYRHQKDRLKQQEQLKRQEESLKKNKPI